MENIIYKKNTELDLVIDGYTSDGVGVAHREGQVFFVPGALSGEKCRVKVLKATPALTYTKLLQVYIESESRQEPECPDFRRCGGCQTQFMRYGHELEFKRQRVDDCLQRIGSLDFSVEEINPSPAVCHYRNKAVFDFRDVNGAPAFGFFRKGTHDIIPVSSCQIQHPKALPAAGCIRDFLEEHRISAYDESTGAGTVRNVFVRTSAATGDFLVCIVTAAGFGDRTRTLVRTLCEAVPEITDIVLCVNKTKGNEILHGDFYSLYGRTYITDILCGLKFKISAAAFYQVNHAQAERLYDKALEYAAVGEHDLAVDLYCGAGTISLCLARVFRRVIACEIVPEAIEDARENARMNAVDNCEFLCADAAELASRLAVSQCRPSVVVVDPPRKGLAEPVIGSICDMAPAHVVYVSCNPATLARDLAIFAKSGYLPQHAEAFDMFPRTAHVETVVLMSRNRE